jgi:DNA-binding NarL/FixJ family response regulator
VSQPDDTELSILLVDDHDLFRSGLRSLLDATGLTVVGEAPSGEAALGLVERRAPDVVVMDLHMPGIGGIEAIRRLAAQAPGTPVIALTVSAADEDVFDALDAGAVGYLLKDAPTEEILRAVRAAAAGESVLSPSVARAVVERVRARASARDRPPPTDLSERELDVLRLIAEGRENAEIARVLHLSPTTVKHHVSSILDKLRVANRVQAAIHAVRHGLV